MIFVKSAKNQLPFAKTRLWQNIYIHKVVDAIILKYCTLSLVEIPEFKNKTKLSCVIVNDKLIAPLIKTHLTELSQNRREPALPDWDHKQSIILVKCLKSLRRWY